MKRFLLLLIGLLLLEIPIAFAGKAEVYKWVDAAGRVQYGEKPQESDAQKLEINTDVNALQRQQTEESLRRMQEENKFYDRGHHEQEEEDQKKAENNAKMDKECAKARAQLGKFEEGGYVWYTTNEEGKRQFMSDGEAKNKKEDTEKWVRENCSGL